MGATSVTGEGNPSVVNKGSVHQTLGYKHIIDLPKFALPFGDFPATSDGFWNNLFGTSSLTLFNVALYNTSFYIFQQQYVNANLITSEDVVRIIDPNDYIATVSFSTTTDPTVAPYPYRVLNITVTANSGPAFVTWLWNGIPFNVTVF